MNKIFVVIHSSDCLDDGECLIGVYSTEEAANKAADRIKTLRPDRLWDDEIGEVLDTSTMEIDTTDETALKLLDNHIEMMKS